MVVKKTFLLVISLMMLALPLSAQDEPVNPIVGYTQYEFFDIMDVFVPADWVEVPIEDVYQNLEGGEAGMSFYSIDGRYALDVFRDSVTGVPRDEAGQRDLIESNLYAIRSITDDGFVDTINGRAFYFDGDVVYESGDYHQVAYVMFASEKIYQMIVSIFPSEDNEITDADLIFAHSLLSNIGLNDRGMFGGDPVKVAIDGGGFRAVVPDDWEQRDPATETTLLSIRQPDDIAIFIVVEGGSYGNPSDEFLVNTFNNRYSAETNEILNQEYVELPLGMAYVGEAISQFESSSGDILPIYNQDYHLLVNGTEYIGLYISVEDEIAEPYKPIFAEIANTVIPISGEVVEARQFDE